MHSLGYSYVSRHESHQATAQSTTWISSWENVEKMLSTGLSRLACSPSFPRKLVPNCPGASQHCISPFPSYNYYLPLPNPYLFTTFTGTNPVQILAPSTPFRVCTAPRRPNAKALIRRKCKAVIVAMPSSSQSFNLPLVAGDPSSETKPTLPVS